MDAVSMIEFKDRFAKPSVLTLHTLIVSLSCQNALPKQSYLQKTGWLINASN